MRYLFKKLFKKKKVVVPPSGEHHDLAAIFSEVNERYFEGKIDIPVIWFGKQVPTASRRVLLGSYHLDKQVIRINRLLDRPLVPRFYVSFILYHEMLHHVYPPFVKKRRRKIHHPRFKEEEKRFEDYEKAHEFGKKNKHLWFC